MKLDIKKVYLLQWSTKETIRNFWSTTETHERGSPKHNNFDFSWPKMLMVVIRSKRSIKPSMGRPRQQKLSLLWSSIPGKKKSNPTSLCFSLRLPLAHRSRFKSLQNASSICWEWFTRWYDPRDPMNLEWEDLELLLEDRPIFKFGSKTGLTIGKYIGVEEEEDEMRVIITQPYTNSNFTESSNSSSVYFMEHSGYYVPLALHIAKDERKTQEESFLGEENREKKTWVVLLKISKTFKALSYQWGILMIELIWKA